MDRVIEYSGLNKKYTKYFILLLLMKSGFLYDFLI